MSAPTTPLDPLVLSRISNLALLARTVVEGTLTGIHRSPHRGSSVEFAEHKPYSPGDEIRHIDWKAYGKSEKYYIKQFEEETNTRAIIVLDISGSMAYRGGAPVSKLQYSVYMAASLTYLLLGQSDAAGLFALGENAAYLPPQASTAQLAVICDALMGLRASASVKIAESIDKAVEKLHRRSLVIAIGDFLEDLDPVSKALRTVRSRGHDMLVLQVIDPHEIEFPFREPLLFQDMESPSQIMADPRTLRSTYVNAFAEHLKGLAAVCAGSGVDYARFTTDTPLDAALARFLSWRQVRSEAWR